MWMELHINRVNAKGQAGNIWVKDIMTTARDHKDLCILPENSTGQSTARVTYLSMRIHPKNCHIVVRWRVQSEHSSHIVKVSVEATYMLTLQALIYIEGNTQTSGPIRNYATRKGKGGKGAKPYRIIQLNCWEVGTHASY